MSVTLDNVTRTVDGVAAHPRRLADAGERHAQRAARADAVGQDLDHAADRRPRQADVGRVLVDGKDVTGVDVRQRSVAMVYQQFINYPSLTRLREHRLAPARAGQAAGGDRERACGGGAAAEARALSSTRTPLQLSGGQQQRTAIARALVKGADLVLLDEPLANLDYKLREELREELPRIFEASGAIFVYATTEPTEALLLGGNTACMWRGRRSLQFGRRPRSTASPQTLRARRCSPIRRSTSSRIEKTGGTCRNMPAATTRRRRRSIRRLPTAPITSAFARIISRSPTASAGRHAVPGTCSVTEITGSESFVHLHSRRIATGLRCCPACTSSSPAQPIDAVLDPDDVFVFDRGRPPRRRTAGT